MLSRKTCQDLKKAGFPQDPPGFYYHETHDQSLGYCSKAWPQYIKCPSTGGLIDAASKELGPYREAKIHLGGGYPDRITASDVIEFGPGGEIDKIPGNWFISDNPNLDEALAALILELAAKKGEGSE